MSRAERLALVERKNSQLPLSTQCDLLSLNRSSLYYQPVPVSPAEIALKHAIDETYTKYPFYGSRRITEHLREYLKMMVARETVQRCMREMGIAGICPGPNLSKRNAAHKIYPYLLRHITASYPNHVWGIDITYIRLRGGWLYLVAVLDWYSRYVIGWELDQTLEMPFVLATVQRSLTQAQPVIWPQGYAARPGQPFHQPAIHRVAVGCWRPGQYGRPRPGDGQHLHRAALAHDQV